MRFQPMAQSSNRFHHRGPSRLRRNKSNARSPHPPFLEPLACRLAPVCRDAPRRFHAVGDGPPRPQSGRDQLTNRAVRPCFRRSRLGRLSRSIATGPIFLAGGAKGRPARFVVAPAADAVVDVAFELGRNLNGFAARHGENSDTNGMDLHEFPIRFDQRNPCRKLA